MDIEKSMTTTESKSSYTIEESYGYGAAAQVHHGHSGQSKCTNYWLPYIRAQPHIITGHIQ